MTKRTSPKCKRLGNKLKQIRNSFGLSQWRVIDALGFTDQIYQADVSNFELGNREPPLPVLLSYARLAGLSVDDLIDDKVSIAGRVAGVVEAAGPAEGSEPPHQSDVQERGAEQPSNVFICPNCNAGVQFIVRVKVKAVRTAEKSERQEERIARGSDSKRRLEEQAERLLTRYKESGLLSAFEEALRAANGDVPRDAGAYFLTWLAGAKPSLVPKLALRTIASSLGVPDQELTAYTFQYVTAIVHKRPVRCFIPTRMMKGELLARSGGSSLRLRVDADGREIAEWVNVRGGAALAGGEFLKELQTSRDVAALKKPGQRK